MESLFIFVLFLLWLAFLLFLRANRIWLFYYLAGSVGMAFLMVHVGRSLVPWETWLKISTALSVYQLASLTGIESKLFEAVPGAISVLVISQDIGWTVLQIGIESSGLLESAVIVGMICFYPRWSLGRKAFLAALGLATTYVANVVRIFFIVSTLQWGGKDFLFLSHTVLGRALFFALIVVVYWYILTLPTLGTVGEKLREEMRR